MKSSSSQMACLQRTLTALQALPEKVTGFHAPVHAS